MAEFDFLKLYGGENLFTSVCPGLGSDRDYSFDPEDDVTRAFLARIGLPEYAIESGGVDRSELKTWGIDPEVFKMAAGTIPTESATSLCPEESDSKYLSHDESVYATLLANNVRDPAKEALIFSEGDCLSGWDAVTVLGNYNARAFEPHLNGASGVTPETSCEYGALLSAGFPPKKLAGLFFEETISGASWWETGKSVLELDATVLAKNADGSVYEGQGQGSAVVVSPYGHVLTADHVVRDEFGYNADMVLSSDGVEYPFTSANILHSDPDSDLAVLYIPELAGAPYARFAETRPEEGSDAYAIGFPGLSEVEIAARNEVDARLLSVGTYIGTAVTDGAQTHEVLSLRLYPGDSGGAVFNADGELTAINHGIVPGQESYGIGIFESDTANPELLELLGEIRSAQEQTCDNDPYATCESVEDPIECDPL